MENGECIDDLANLKKFCKVVHKVATIRDRIVNFFFKLFKNLLILFIPFIPIFKFLLNILCDAIYKIFELFGYIIAACEIMIGAVFIVFFPILAYFAIKFVLNVECPNFNDYLLFNVVMFISAVAYYIYGFYILTYDLEDYCKKKLA